MIAIGAVQISSKRYLEECDILKKAAIYFANGTDLSVYLQAYLNKLTRQLNERSRKMLESETRAEGLNACVSSTG